VLHVRVQLALRAQLSCVTVVIDEVNDETDKVTGGGVRGGGGCSNRKCVTRGRVAGGECLLARPKAVCADRRRPK
jgi:hypothetical protein